MQQSRYIWRDLSKSSHQSGRLLMPGWSMLLRWSLAAKVLFTKSVWGHPGLADGTGEKKSTALLVLTCALQVSTGVQQSRAAQTESALLQLQHTDCSGAPRKRDWKPPLYEGVHFVFLAAALQQRRFTAQHKTRGEMIMGNKHWKRWNSITKCWILCSELFYCLQKQIAFINSSSTASGRKMV